MRIRLAMFISPPSIQLLDRATTPRVVPRLGFDECSLVRVGSRPSVVGGSKQLRPGKPFNSFGSL